VVEGDRVSVNYDPLLAKLTASAESRPAAIGRAAAALREFPILGIRTNVPFLIRVLEHPAFAAGDLHTAFIDQHAAALLERSDTPAVVFAAAAVVDETAAPAFRGIAAADPWTDITGWGR
jgi:acetyl/propionyl-CoA carboxylase alpha subunit